MRTPQVPQEIEQRFIQLRREYPGEGARKIAIRMRREGYAISHATADRLCSRLLEAGRIVRTSAVAYRKKRRAQNTRRREKPPIPQYPGDLAQIDTWSHSIVPGYVFYQVSIVDTVTRYASTYLGSSPSSTAAARCLEQALHDFPFELRAVQHDGGSEFAGAFAALCERRGVQRYQLPPRSPKLNAKVERIHLTWKNEYWNAYSLPYWKIEDLRPILGKWQGRVQ